MSIYFLLIFFLSWFLDLCRNKESFEYISKLLEILILFLVYYSGRNKATDTVKIRDIRQC